MTEKYYTKDQLKSLLDSSEISSEFREKITVALKDGSQSAIEALGIVGSTMSQTAGTDVGNVSIARGSIRKDIIIKKIAEKLSMSGLIPDEYNDRDWADEAAPIIEEAFDEILEYIKNDLNKKIEMIESLIKNGSVEDFTQS